jgi:hypothetical protein
MSPHPAGNHIKPLVERRLGLDEARLIIMAKSSRLAGVWFFFAV